MGRGFLSGFVWGSIISVLVLGTASLLMPPPARPSAEGAELTLDQARPAEPARETEQRTDSAAPPASPPTTPNPIAPPPITLPPIAPPPAQDAGTPAEPALPGAGEEVAPAPESPAEPPAPRAEEAAPSQEKPGTQDATGTVAPQAASPFERHPVPLTERADARSSLPQVGTEPDVSGASAGTLAPDAHRLGQAPAALGRDAPLARNARPFSNPEGKPLMSIILIDGGAGDGLDLTGLAAMTIPVTFAVDPMRPGAAQAMARYADAGFEVVALATGLPMGARAADLETTLGSNLAAIDRAVAVMDPQADGFSGNRELEQQAMAMTAQEGYGLIGWGGGLGLLENAARRNEAPIALIYRAFDADGAQPTEISRALDRAAFKATQDGSVLMAGQARPEAAATLLEWARGSQAAQVALAPVSAILTR